MIYVLWDLDSRNLIATYATRSAALADLREAVAAHGSAYVESLMLGEEPPRGRARTIAHGPELVALALASTAEREIA